MSVGRPDPFASKVFSPEEYDRNRASIETARAKLEDFAKMNEIGRKNYEFIQKQEREERELTQKILEGELAKQRLQQLQQRKSLAMTNQSTSWIEEAGSSNAGCLQDGVSLQNNFVPYPPSMSEAMMQPTSVSSFEGSTIHTHPNQAQQHNPTRTYSGSSQFNPNNASQHRYSTQSPYQRNYPQSAQPHIQTPTPRQSFPGQQPHNVSQAQTDRPQPDQQSYNNMYYRRSYDAPNFSTPSLVGAPLTTAIPTPLLEILMPACPTVSQIQTIKRYLDLWASGVPPQTQYEGTIRWDTYSVKCFKDKDSVIIFSIETPNGPVNAAAHGILDDLLAKAAAPQTSMNSATSTASAPAVGDSISTNSTRLPTSQTPTVASSSSTRNATNSYTVDPPVARTAQQSTNQTSVESSSSSVAQTATTATTATTALPPVARTQQPHIDRTQAASSSSTTQNTASAQAISSPVPIQLPASRTMTERSPDVVPDVAKQRIALLPVVNTPARPATQVPAAFSPPVAKGVSTPANHSTPGIPNGATITPQQADKKRIAQSLLWALGKRPRESSSNVDSKNSKRHASETAVKAQTMSNQAQPLHGSSHPGIGPSSTIPTPHILANTPNVSQNSAQSSKVGDVPVASANPPTGLPQPSKSDTQPMSSASPSSNVPQNHAQSSYVRDVPIAPASPPTGLPQPAQSDTQPASSASPSSTVPQNHPQDFDIKDVPITPANPPTGLPQPAQSDTQPASSALPSSTIPQNHAQDSDVRDVPIAPANPPTGLPQPAQSDTQPASSASASSTTPVQTTQQYPNATGSITALPYSPNAIRRDYYGRPSQATSEETQSVPLVSADLGVTQAGPSSQMPSSGILSGQSLNPNVSQAPLTQVVQYPNSFTVGTALYTRPVSFLTPAQPSAMLSISGETREPGSKRSAISEGAKSPLKPKVKTKPGLDDDPLFLPSSSPESGPSSSRGQNETLDWAAKSVTRRRPNENRAYVLVPPAPDYLVLYREQMRRKRSGGLQKEAHPASLPESVVGEEDFWYTFESQRGSPSDENEREAIKLACSRLQASPCRWSRCDAIMNSGEALIRHLNLHKPKPSQNTRTFMCRWTQCGQQGVRFGDSQHLKKHALLPLRCAYMDCKDTFRSGGQLLNHFRKKHADGKLKPSTKPEAPITETAVLPEIPAPFPSYLLSTDLARGEVLSKERHLLVGQRVLMNITFVDDGTPLKRRSKKTARPASHALPDPTAHLTNDYQFLTTKNSARSSTYSSQACDIDHDDLDSAQISRMVGQGLVFWGSNDEDDGGPATEAVAVAAGSDSPLFSPEPLQQASDAEIKLEAETGAEPGYGHSSFAGRQTGNDEFHTSDVEDAAVETMLTDMTLTS